MQDQTTPRVAVTGEMPEWLFTRANALYAAAYWCSQLAQQHERGTWPAPDQYAYDLTEISDVYHARWAAITDEWRA